MTNPSPALANLARWVSIEFPTDMPYAEGQPVEAASTDRHGRVVAWAADYQAFRRYETTGDPENLIDNEGPVVLWSGTTVLSWYPGQAMSLLAVTAELPTD